MLIGYGDQEPDWICSVGTKVLLEGLGCWKMVVFGRKEGLMRIHIGIDIPGNEASPRKSTSRQIQATLSR